VVTALGTPTFSPQRQRQDAVSTPRQRLAGDAQIGSARAVFFPTITVSAAVELSWA